MSDADRIAIRVKSAHHRMHMTAVVLGKAEIAAITRNAEPCDPPDYDATANTFCGLPIIEAPDETRLAIAIDLNTVEPR